MRQVTIFYAFDDTEFSTRESCEQYEKHYRAILNRIFRKYIFFNAGMNEIPYKVFNTIEEEMAYLIYCFYECRYIRRIENLTEEEDTFVATNFGLFINNQDFNYEIGWFHWDKDKTGWEKVDD